EGGDRRAGEALVGAATAAGADLLVMGAYGQSRMREMVLGGATWNILHRAAMPVLMSH
ncbi:MAG TPA: universal stress protein, partial [Azospirillaceae bacterium]|nr:universal stress protein [Azospirillaceae bacterium]